MISAILGTCRLSKSKEKRFESLIRGPSPRERAQDTRNSSQDTNQASSQHYNTNERDTKSKAECTERCFRRASPRERAKDTSDSRKIASDAPTGA